MTRLTTAGALLEVQLLHLTAQGQPLIDDPVAGATEMLDFLAAVPQALAEVMGGTLDELERGGLVGMAPADREQLLLRLRADTAWRGRLSLLTRLGWLIIYSRPPARRLVGFRDPREFAPGDPTVDVPQPPVPPLDGDYDVCIVGSGAGAAVVAARLAEAGKRVLMVERGNWISPRDLPTRDDEALRRLYLHAGVNPALSGEVHAIIDICRNQIGTINVLQAGVVGGGPYVNNAILLPMAQSTWEIWHKKFDFPIDWAPLQQRMDLVARELGSTPPGTAAGPRSQLFRQGAGQAGHPSSDLPLAIHECLGCGGCNVGCRFGRKTGGLHGERPAGAPVSYLHRALRAGPGPAAIRPQLEAVKFKPTGFGSNRIGALVARDLSAGGREVEIRARSFALAAGPIASSQILGRTLPNPDFRPGTGIAANVVMPVFALSATPFTGAPDPGIEMCYFVDSGGGLLLESWFHYPATLAVAVPGWLDEHATIMRQYRQLASAGVVVPSKPSGRLSFLTDIVLGLDGDELERLKRGVAELARLFLASDVVDTVIPSTSEPLPIRKGQQDADVARFRAQVTAPAHLNLGTAHPQGGNRIGKHSGSSVVDRSFKVHGVTNLFVTDASVFPAGCGVNPQLTAMALASLAADEILHSLG
jgi:choline dehydrogenase-like flavoprotein